LSTLVYDVIQTKSMSEFATYDTGKLGFFLCLRSEGYLWS